MEISKPRKIFLVDDDEMLTTALTDYLTRKTEHQITIFHTGEDCIKHLQQEPEIIILDYYLNSVDKNAANGMEVLQTLKKFHIKSHIIMLSSQERYGIALQSINEGAEHYVIKDENAFEKINTLINSFD